MEHSNVKKVKEELKQIMKAELKETVATSLEKHSTELAIHIRRIVNEITEWEWKQKGFKVVWQAAEKGAVGMAIDPLIEKVAQDAVKHASPKIEEFLDIIRTIISEATAEAISELIKEEIKKRGHKENG